MSTAIDGVIERLRGAEDVAKIFETIDAWSDAGRLSDLVDLALAVVTRGEGSAEAREQVVDQIEEVLALTPGDDRVDAVLTLAGKNRARAIASRLGHGQGKDGLVSALARFADDADKTELLACWVHELVLRGTSLANEPAVKAFHAKLASSGHALGELPLSLLSVEAEAPTYMPLYGSAAIDSAVMRLENGPASAMSLPPPGDSSAPSATRIDDAALEKRLAEAALPWTEGGIGALEARVFSLSPALTSGSPGKWLLRSLPLESVRDAKGLRAERVTPEVVWGALFAAASNGGASSSGLGGAYGRVAAWRSLGALVDAPGPASVTTVEALTSKSSFLKFGAAGPWFRDVAWDLGLLALRPGGTTCAVLAATDSD